MKDFGFLEKQSLTFHCLMIYALKRNLFMD